MTVKQQPKVIRENLQKALLYKKSAWKMLMKLTPVIGLNHQNQVTLI